MKIVLLGSTGQIGWELQRTLAPLGRVIPLQRQGNNLLCGDLLHIDDLKKSIRILQPNIIVNAAAYTAVDQAETDADLAEAINADAPEMLAREAEHLDAWYVHYSTDYVFDGTESSPRKEGDTTQPINIYGSTKLRGEQGVKTATKRHLIFRTQWIYSTRGKNFLRTILRLASERELLKVIDDQFGAPTGAELVADVTAHALHTALRKPETAGTYHLAARGKATWFEYAKYAIETARQEGWEIKTPSDAIEPVKSSAYPTQARRPLYTCLDCSKIEQTFKISMPDWHDGIKRVIMQLRSTEAKE